MIDDHCHPFSLEGGPLDLSLLTLDIHPDTGGRRARLEPSRVGHELLAVRLGKRLGCAPEEVPEARAEASKDWGAYVSGLFREAGLEALIMDPAYPPDAAQNLDLYRDLAGCPVHPIFRIETVIDPLMEQGASLTEIVESMEEGMRRAAGRGYVGFKTILAYRTGLAVDADVTKEAAERSLRSQVPVRRRGKAARDYLLRRALGTAADLGRAFQIHTGMGDSDIRLAEANPLLLEDLLRTPEGSAAPIVLIHGSYPWHEELAYLAWTRPNVWADLTLFNLFSTVTTADRLLRVLDLAPSRKVVVGTDAYHEPELFWFGAMVMAEAWDSVAARFEDAGARRSWIEQARDQVFEGNARELYGI